MALIHKQIYIVELSQFLYLSYFLHPINLFFLGYFFQFLKLLNVYTKLNSVRGHSLGVFADK